MISQREYVNAFHDGDKNMLLFRKDGELRAQAVSAEHVTYFARNEKLEALLKRSQYVTSLKQDEKYIRVGWRNAQVRKDMLFDERSPIKKLGLPSYEGDVDPVLRYFVDSNAKIAKPRGIYLDIETDSRVPFSKKEEMRVLTWALVDHDDVLIANGVLEEDTDEAEKILLDALWLALKPYDQVIAWYGDSFDFPVVWERSKRRKCPGVNAFKWLWLDHMVLFEKLNKHSAESGDEKTSMKLNDIAQAKIGEGKEVIPDYVAERWPGKSLGEIAWDLWEAGGEFRALLVKYNIQDTHLLARIEKKTGYIALFQTICETCHIFGNTQSLNPTKQMDGFMMRLGLERGHHFDTKNFFEGTAKFKGAFVMQPTSLDKAWREKRGMTSGILRNVHVADFSGMYPSIILTWNMSPDTKVLANVNGPVQEGTCRSPLTGVSFRTGAHGILVTALIEMMRLRKYWNDKKSEYAPRTPEWYDCDRRSTAYKVAANSFYGVIGSPFSRFFDKSIAESVTQNGVWLIKETMAEAEKRGMTIVYGDTDSIFVVGATKAEFEELVKYCNEVLYPKILKAQGCTENYIKLAYEKEFKHIVFTSAKRYVGVYEHYKGKQATKDSKPEIKGLEFNRGDASRGARELQKLAIDLIVADNQTLEDYHTVVSRARTHVLEEPLHIDEVKISKSLGRPLKEYVAKMKTDGTPAAQPPHVAIAHLLKARGLEIRESTRIEYIVTDGSCSPMKVLPASEYDNNCDRFYIWENTMFPPTQRLLEATFPDHNWETWLKVRPMKPRGKHKVLEGQLDLPASEKRFSVNTKLAPVLEVPPVVKQIIAEAMAGMDAAVAPRPRKGDYKLRVGHKVNIEKLRLVLERHPGTRKVMVTIVLKDGSEADLILAPRVNGSIQLSAELEPFKLKPTA